MVIFNSYVKLPEGKCQSKTPCAEPAWFVFFLSESATRRAAILDCRLYPPWLWALLSLGSIESTNPMDLKWGYPMNAHRSNKKPQIIVGS